jgi:uncharacterized membrane protein
MALVFGTLSAIVGFFAIGIAAEKRRRPHSNAAPFSARDQGN